MIQQVSSAPIANIQRNSYGDNDVIGIVDGTVNSVGARTVYGTIDLVSQYEPLPLMLV